MKRGYLAYLFAIFMATYVLYHGTAFIVNEAKQEFFIGESVSQNYEEVVIDYNQKQTITNEQVYEKNVEDNEICKEFIPNHNKKENKINIVFVGIGFESKNEFLEKLPAYVDFQGNGVEHNNEIFRGIFGYEPSKSNKDKFNIWYVNKIGDFVNTRINSDICLDYCKNNHKEFCNEKINYQNKKTNNQNAISITLCNRYCLSRARLLDDTFVGIKTKDNKWRAYSIRVAVHEFGHSFAGLIDEYSKETPESIERQNFVVYSDPKNCLGSIKQAKKEWKNFIGLGKGEQKTGFFTGNPINCFNIFLSKDVNNKNNKNYITNEITENCFFTASNSVQNEKFIKFLALSKADCLQSIENCMFYDIRSNKIICIDKRKEKEKIDECTHLIESYRYIPQGCAGNKNNIRSTLRSMMNRNYDTDDGFGPVNEKAIINRIKQLAG